MIPRGRPQGGWASGDCPHQVIAPRGEEEWPQCVGPRGGERVSPRVLEGPRLVGPWGVLVGPSGLGPSGVGTPTRRVVEGGDGRDPQGFVPKRVGRRGLVSGVAPGGAG